MPRVPETKTDGEALTAARDLLADFLTQLNRWTPGRRRQSAASTWAASHRAALGVTNEMLGDGEVSIQVNGARRLRIQESVFTGLWRAVELDGDGGLRRRLDRGRSAARGRGRSGTRRRAHGVAARSRFPPGAMNSPALLHELRRADCDATSGHVRARAQPDAVPADAGGPPGPRARAAGRLGGDHFARLRQLPHHVDRMRATSGACSTSTA